MFNDVRLFVLYAVIFFLSLSPANADITNSTDGYRVAPAPDWVTANTIPVQSEIPIEQIDNGIFNLLVDQQTKVDGASVTNFYRFAYKIVNEVGVEQESDISIDFDASYETVTLHHVNIRRAGVVINQLIPENIRVLYQERDLKKLMYDGNLTIHLLLEGVRRGDVIEYSYSRSGANPALEGRFYGSFDANWSVPVAERHYRLLWPRHRTLRYKAYNGNLEPEVTHKGSFDEYVWHLEHLPTAFRENDAPSWYYPWAWVQFSEAADWQEVAEHEAQIFTKEYPVPEELRAVLKRIRNAHPVKSDQMLAALRFVQDEIRYVAINLGTGGMIPNPPEKTLQRLYGDCKDKTVLLLTMLRELDIVAHPALVDTEYRDELKTYLPSQTVFNHVLVQAKLGGKTYWLDGTLSNQRGSREFLTEPDFGAALVLREGTTGLTSMKPRQPTRPSREIDKYLDLSRGPGEAAILKITKVFRDSQANWFRGYLRSNGLQYLADSQLRYYGSDYRGVAYAKRPEVIDDDEHNEITLKLSFDVPNPWYAGDEAGLWHADVFLDEVYRHLKAPPDIHRTSPFDLEFPWRVRMTSTISLPGDWEDWVADDTVANKHFFFKKTDRNWANVIRESYDYTVQKDYVATDKLAHYREDIEKARNLAQNYTLNYYPSGEES